MNKAAAYLLIAGMQPTMTKQAAGNWFQSYFGNNYGSTVDRRTADMYNAGVDYRTIMNYRDMWNHNTPTWYNPLDWFNFGRYARNDGQLEDWRKRTMDKAKEERAKKNLPAPPQQKTRIIMK